MRKIECWFNWREKSLVRDREKSLEKSQNLIKGVIKTIFF